MSLTDPVWVLVDALYRRGKNGFVARTEGLDVAAEAATRDESQAALSAAVARHLRPRLVAGTLADYLVDCGFYRSATGEWVPRVTGGDERLYVRVTPLEPLTLVNAVLDDPEGSA